MGHSCFWCSIIQFLSDNDPENWIEPAIIYTVVTSVFAPNTNVGELMLLSPVTVFFPFSSCKMEIIQQLTPVIYELAAGTESKSVRSIRPEYFIFYCKYYIKSNFVKTFSHKVMLTPIGESSGERYKPLSLVSVSSDSAARYWPLRPYLQLVTDLDVSQYKSSIWKLKIFTGSTFPTCLFLH